VWWKGYCAIPVYNEERHLEHVDEVRRYTPQISGHRRRLRIATGELPGRQTDLTVLTHSPAIGGYGAALNRLSRMR